MDILFSKYLHITLTLNEACRNLIQVLKETYETSDSKRIGFVSGAITADGPEHIERNIKKLLEYTNLLNKGYSFSIFSDPQVFTSEMNNRYKKQGVAYHEFIEFWRKVLKSGYITDIFMTPGWERSTGAKDEYLLAKKLGLHIHILS
jgi:hypothetical protein